MTARNIVNIALIGFMGTGKSSVARLVGEQLRFEFLDTDELIEARAGKSITEIFAQNGESAFRQLERQLVADGAGLIGDYRTVIATGGGLPVDPANLDQLRQHALVICLWASPDKIFERVHNQSHRPLLQDPDPRAKIRALLTAREPFYRQADVLLNSEFRSIREVAQQVVNQFRLASQPRK